jgi:predicted transcriptional regulator
MSVGLPPGGPEIYLFTLRIAVRGHRSLDRRLRRGDGTTEQRTLIVTVQPDWRGALRAAGRAAEERQYQGERWNFETPEAFFGHLTARRWALVQLLVGAGEVSVRELARRAGRNVRRIHEDVTALADLGLLERTDRGGVVCPFADIQVDMHLREVV